MGRPTAMGYRRGVFALAVCFLVSACAAGASPSVGGATASPVATVSPSPTASATLPAATASPGATTSGGITNPALKIRLVERFGPLWYCDPDFTPVARQDEATLALERWPEIAADAVALGLIGRHLGIAETGTPTDAQKLAIYRTWKVLRAITLQPRGDRFGFDYLAMPQSGATQGTRSTGTIDQAGTIIVASSLPTREPQCPICLARGQLVETPRGRVAVEALGLGDPVWTRDVEGRRVAGIVLALGSAVAPAGHETVRLVLADGRTIEASPAHPLADGRRVGELRPGDRVEGALVRSVDRVSYGASETFDLLPSGPTGAYAVDGIWLASTLGP